MPKVRAFSSEPMRWDRLLYTHRDRYPFDVGLVTTHGQHDMLAWSQGFTRFLLPTMKEYPGKITSLRCSAGLFTTEFGRGLFRSHIPSTFKHLTRIDLTYSWSVWRSWIHWRHSTGNGYSYLRSLQGALFAASDLQELSIVFDCGLEGYGPPFRMPDWMFRDEDGRPHKWKCLRSLRLAYLVKTEAWLVPLIAAHADTLRHLDLEHCNLKDWFAGRLARIRGKAPQLRSIAINEPGLRESDLISEQKLLDYIDHGPKDLDKEWAQKTGKDLPSDAGEAELDWASEDEGSSDDEEDLSSEDSDYNPEFEYTAEAEEDYNSDEESPPLFRWMKWNWSETEQIEIGRFVTHSNLREDADDNDCHDADNDETSDHSSEWWSDTDSEL